MGNIFAENSSGWCLQQTLLNLVVSLLESNRRLCIWGSHHFSMGQNAAGKRKLMFWVNKSSSMSLNYQWSISILREQRSLVNLQCMAGNWGLKFSLRFWLRISENQSHTSKYCWLEDTFLNVMFQINDWFVKSKSMFSGFWLACK